MDYLYGHLRIVRIHSKYIDSPTVIVGTDFIILEIFDVVEIYIIPIKLLAQYTDTVEEAARVLEPHRIIFYLIDLASEFHRFYNRHRIITEDGELTGARLYLAWAVGKVLRSGLATVGVSAPEQM